MLEFNISISFFYGNLSQILLCFKYLLNDELFEKEKKNLIEIRDLICEILLNNEFYSKEDKNIIKESFQLLEQIVFSSKEYSQSLFSNKTFQQILSFSEIFRNLIQGEFIYNKVLTSFLSICVNQNEQIINKLIDFVIVPPDMYICNEILTILSKYEFVKKIAEDKIKEIVKNLDITYDENESKKINKNIYNSVIKILIQFLIFNPSTNIQKNEFMILKEISFNSKIYAFSDLFLYHPNSDFINDLKNKNEIIGIIMNIIFYNFNEKDNSNLIITFYMDILKYYNNNCSNYIENLYNIIFVQNSELTANVFISLLENNNTNKINIKDFIEKNFFNIIILKKNNFFLYSFFLKCFKDINDNSIFEFFNKFINFIIDNVLDEKMIFICIQILDLLENYLNFITQEIENEDLFILSLSSFLSKIKDNGFYYDIIKQNEYNIQISIFERLYNVYYLLFEKCSKKQPNLEKLFNSTFIHDNKTIFSLIDENIKKNKKINVTNINYITKLNYSVYFFTRYCVEEIPKNYEELFDSFFGKLFKELLKINISKIDNVNEIQNYNEIKNKLMKNRTNIEFTEFKTFIHNKLPFDNLFKSNIKNKQVITFEKKNNKYKQDISILQNDLLKNRDNIHNKSFQFIKVLKTNPNNKQIFELRLFNEEKGHKSIEDLNEHIILNPKSDLLLKNYSLYFQDIYFNDENFKNLKTYYKSHFDCQRETKLLNFPSKIKNFSNIYEPPLFLKKNLKFYDDHCFTISHKYFIPYLKKLNLKTIPFYKKPIRILDKKNKFDCEFINIKYIIEGIIYLENDFVLFENSDFSNKNYIFTSDKIDKIQKNKRILFYYSNIKKYTKRQFLFKNQGIEFFLKNGKSFYFNLLLEKNLEDLMIILENKTKINIKNESITSYLKQWEQSQISTYEYLNYINYFSLRTYNDPSQYPIFPWVTKDMRKIFEDNQNFEKNTLDFTKEHVYNNKLIEEENTGFRTFKYPISVQTNDKRKRNLDKYINLDEKEKYHHFTYFSTSPYVFYYLMRINPFTNNLIKLQNYSQENVNRMFISNEYIQKILLEGNDTRELIPEFFCKIEQFINLNCVYFGERERTILDDLIPNDYINKKNISEDSKLNNVLCQFIELIRLNRKILNSNYVNNSNMDSISNWIDNIYGKFQYIENESIAREKYNTYTFTTYKQKCKLNDLVQLYENSKKKNDNKKDDLLNDIQYRINLMINFGMMPYKIFNDIHPIKKIIENSDEKNYMIEDYPNYPKGYKFLFYSNNYFFILNENKDIIMNNKKKKEKADKLLISPFDFDENKLYQNLRYTINFSIPNFVITCKYKDNSFRIKNITNNEEIKFLCEDYVNSINVYSEKNYIFIGLKNGKIEKYLFENNKLTFINSIVAHFDPIEIIEINLNLNIIISNSKDNLILIRKLYDFELLTIIKIPKGYEIKLIKLSPLNFIYILCDYLNKEKQTKSTIFGYTVSGIKFIQCKFDVINNICFTNDGDLILGFYNRPYLYICKGSSLSVIYKRLISYDNFKINKIYWFEEYHLNKKIKILMTINETKNLLYYIKNEKELWKDVNYN